MANKKAKSAKKPKALRKSKKLEATKPLVTFNFTKIEP